MKRGKKGEIGRRLAGVGREDGGSAREDCGSAMDGDKSSPVLLNRALQCTIFNSAGIGRKRRERDDLDRAHLHRR
jgi:hypothetical protein